MKAICLLIGLSVLMSSPAWAASPATSVRNGNRLYSQGNFDDAGRRYQEALEKNPESAVVNFDAGTSFYKQKRYPEAIQYLQKALLSDDPRLKEMVYYNLGNTLYQSGIGHEKKDTAAAVQALQESLDHFESALRLDKTDKDAQYNYEFVKKELERLKQEQKKQQSSQGQKEKQSRDSRSKEDQKSQASEQGQGQQSESQRKQAQESRGQQSAAEKQETSEDKEPAAPEASEKKESEAPRSTAAGSRQESGQPLQERGDQAASAAAGNSRDLTKEEAEQILQSYQQSEEPRGLLKVFQNKGESRPVLKDW